jgi:ADP-ribose pyrophosphatase YjhB (NUDIX family)
MARGPALTADVVLLAGDPPSSVLLIERGGDPFAGRWALPGGFIEAGERVPEGALRELAEETGVVLEGPLELLGVYDTPGRDPRGPTVSVTYVRRCASELAATGGDDARRARWFALGVLPALAFDHDTVVADAIRRASPGDRAI